MFCFIFVFIKKIQIRGVEKDLTWTHILKTKILQREHVLSYQSGQLGQPTHRSGSSQKHCHTPKKVIITHTLHFTNTLKNSRERKKIKILEREKAAAKTQQRVKKFSAER